VASDLRLRDNAMWGCGAGAQGGVIARGPQVVPKCRWDVGVAAKALPAGFSAALSLVAGTGQSASWRASWGAVRGTACSESFGELRERRARGHA
jgi:hypothetical protein